MRKVVYESQRQGKSDEMDKMFKQKMNQEQKLYGQEIGCRCSVNVSVCVQGVCVYGCATCTCMKGVDMQQQQQGHSIAAAKKFLTIAGVMRGQSGKREMGRYQWETHCAWRGSLPWR